MKKNTSSNKKTKTCNHKTTNETQKAKPTQKQDHVRKGVEK